MGNEAIFRSAAQHMLAEVDSMMEHVTEAVSCKDPKTIEEKAHWLKGGLAYLHAAPSAEAAQELQKAARLGDSEREAALVKLRQEIDRLKTALSSIMVDSKTFRN